LVGLALVTVLAAGLLAACGGGGGGSVAGYCKLVRDVDTQYANSDDIDMQTALDIFEKVANKAPSEIRSDLQYLLETSSKAINNPLSVANEGDKFDKASEHVQTYTQEKCDVDMGLTGS
jgi:hypothetical protein